MTAEEEIAEVARQRRKPVQRELELGDLLIVFRWEDDSRPSHLPGPLWIDFEIFETINLGSRLYYLPGHNRSWNHVTTNHVEGESEVYGFVKWDGCTQVYAPHLHYDDKDGLRAMLGAIERAQAECYDVLPDH